MVVIEGVAIPSAGIECADLRLTGSEIAALERRPRPVGGPRPDLLLPGCVDIHIHGAGGHDLGEPDKLGVTAATLARWGVTAFLPTFYPRPLPELVANIEQAVDAARGLPAGTARVPGFHLEGPFVSPEAPGALDPKSILVADPGHLRRLLEAGKGMIRLITLAPELPGVEELIRLSVSMGAQVSLGHTRADTGQVAAALAAGATRVTHLFNAMSPLGHREPGLVGAALRPGGPGPELIADGAHVVPEVMRLVIAARGGAGEGLCLVSDALAPAGTSAEEGRFCGRTLRIRDGGLLDKGGRLNGSALLLSQGVDRLVGMGVIDWALAGRLAAENPARVAGLERTGRVEPGWKADLVLWREGRPLRVWIGGVEVDLG